MHSPPSVRTIPLAAQQVPSLLLVANATVLVHRTHSRWSSQCNCAGSPHTFPTVIPMMLYTPLRDSTPPPASQSGPALPSLGHHHQVQLCRFTRHQTDTHPMVSPRMPCTPLRVCAPPHLPMWASLVVGVTGN